MPLAPRPAARTTRRVFAPLPLPTPWWERVPTAAVVLALLFAFLVVACLALPLPYAVRVPGPTVDTLGESDETPLITVVDAETYPSEGELRLTTVSAFGGPGYRVTMPRVLGGFFDPRATVLPREAVFPSDQTREEAEEQGQAQMTSSQERATVAALTALGYEVPAVLRVAAVVADGPTADVLAAGDVIQGLEVAGQEVATPSFDALTDELAQLPPGTQVRLLVDRDGEQLTLGARTGPDGAGGSVLGVLISPDFSPPVEVDIEIANIGGPSAGTMFALGIMEQLTPGDATGGHVIAGTGTIDLSGNVGAIGGIVQKLHGAARDGAEYFLAPLSNCGEVVGNVPTGLQVVAVETLTQAWDAVTAIGAGETDQLPECTSAVPAG